jgi:hypothetical protein
MLTTPVDGVADDFARHLQRDQGTATTSTTRTVRTWATSRSSLIDMASGKIAYALLSFGGLVGMGDKLFAVSWAALTLDTVNKRFTLNVPKGSSQGCPRLRPAPLAVHVRQDLGQRGAQVLTTGQFVVPCVCWRTDAFRTDAG